MKPHFNKVLSLILAIIMLFTTVPLNAMNLTSEATDSEVSESQSTQISEQQSSETINSESTLSESSEEANILSQGNSLGNTLSLNNGNDSSQSQFLVNSNNVEFNEEDEPTEDGWELSLVFYDSTVDGGTTPLQAINWDASSTAYNVANSRTITVQINYKNTNTVTEYEPGTLEIRIPNLIYNTSSSGSAQWSTSAIVGANDNTHSNYEWTFITGNSPTNSQEYYSFTNAKKIEKKANLEGSIQIVYTITSSSESPESYLDECIHNYSKILQATFAKRGERIIENHKLTNIETVITSPNFPNGYNDNMSTSTDYWEYTSPTSENLMIQFSNDSFLENSYDYVYIYDKTGTQLAVYTGTEMVGKTIYVSGNYVKFAMKTDGSVQKTGFKANVGTGETETIIPEGMIFSNELNFNFTRTYTHPWQQRTYTITKTASQIISLDGFPQGEYIWVKYTFRMDGRTSSKYPYVGASYYIEDNLPPECLVLNNSFQIQELENGYYQDSSFSDTSTSYRYEYIYVGYPKSVYNDEAGNLNITNHVDLSVKYGNEEEFEFADDAEVAINLNDFDFQYTGELYSVTKSYDSNSNDGTFYSTFMLDPEFSHTCSNCSYGHADTMRGWTISASATYTGIPQTVRVGDDLMYISAADGSYRKMNDNEYYIYSITIPAFKNKNGLSIEKEKYNTNLYVRYAGEEEFTLYQKIMNGSSATSSQTISFKDLDRKVVAFYIQIDDMLESLIFSSLIVQTELTPTGNIAAEGKFYNFDFINVFSKAEDGTLTLLNPASVDGYATITTQENIAEYDLETYGYYMQRDEYSTSYKEYSVANVAYSVSTFKSMTAPVQDIAKEEFQTRNTIGFIMNGDSEFYTMYSSNEYLQKLYFDYVDDIKLIEGYACYDLLPKGLELDSSESEIINSLTVGNTSYYKYYYFNNGTQAFASAQEFIDFIKEHATINVIGNWKGTNRTKVELIVNFEETPLFFIYGSRSSGKNYYPYVSISFDSYVSYDSFLEHGKNYTNYVYAEMYVSGERRPTSGTKDTGSLDPEASDINENGITEEYITYSSAYINITSVVSAYQDITKYVQTEISNYSTGIVDSLCNAPYTYKLRVRTGAAKVSNFIIYDNIEAANGKKTFWQGTFNGTDTSYATKQGYKIKTYYSENPEAGNLYNEDGTLNSDWLQYHNESREAGFIGGSLAIKFNSQCKTESVTYDWVDIFYKKDNITYKLGRWGGTELSGKTIIVPSGDFWLYWRTDSSQCSYYGFSIDSITPVLEEGAVGTQTSLPTYTAEEITGNTYPNSAFGSYTHGNYGNNVNKVWHYTYDGPMGEYQEEIIATDRSKVKSLAFEYLDKDGDPAMIMPGTMTYVLVKMTSPADENITSLARNSCRAQWNAYDDYNNKVDFIEGMTSNIVKVALPNSIKANDLPTASVNFVKSIRITDAIEEQLRTLLVSQGVYTEDEFDDLSNEELKQLALENLKLADQGFNFQIVLTYQTQNEDGSYNKVQGILNSNNSLTFSNLLVGRYKIEEGADLFFNFRDFEDNTDPELLTGGISFIHNDDGYFIEIEEDIKDNVFISIKVNNYPDEKRPYDSKQDKSNLFKYQDPNLV